MLGRPWVAGIAAVFSSPERKAREGAELFGLPMTIVAGLAENDRTATGYLPKAAFEALADAFFGQPEASILGWERALDAQARILAAVDRVLSLGPSAGDLAIVAHGGVGGLLLAALTGVPISRDCDQPGAGGGNRFSFARADRRLLSGWRPIEA